MEGGRGGGSGAWGGPGASGGSVLEQHEGRGVEERVLDTPEEKAPEESSIY